MPMFRLVLMGISFQSRLPERCRSNAFLGLKSCFAANLGSGVGGGNVAKITRPSVANGFLPLTARQEQNPMVF